MLTIILFWLLWFVVMVAGGVLFAICKRRIRPINMYWLVLGIVVCCWAYFVVTLMSLCLPNSMQEDNSNLSIVFVLLSVGIFHISNVCFQKLWLYKKKQQFRKRN